MRRLFPISLFLIFMICTAFDSFAGTYDERNKPGDDKKTKKRDDTTAYVINEESLETDTSLVLFPSNDLYASWDTSIIHPYNFNECFKADSTVLCLAEIGQNFVMPYKGMVTSDFGWRRRRPHFGTDIDLETGDTVVSAFDGMVRIAKANSGGYGNVVIVRHTNGLETVYGHLSKINVEVGQPVTAGEILGLGGNTGRSYGSHLHFEIRYLGQALDAEDFIDFAKGELKSYEFTLRKSDVENKYDLRALRSRHKHDVGMARYETRKNGTKVLVYRVRPGDNLGKIAQRHHTTVKALCKKNGFKPTKVLQIGQKIKI
jgi:murein DD-endopeptidase MepM/ murein hydrolase activator NlpD